MLGPLPYVFFLCKIVIVPLTGRGGGAQQNVRAIKEIRTFKTFFFSSKSSDCTPEGGGGKALIELPLKKIAFFAASLKGLCVFYS